MTESDAFKYSSENLPKSRRDDSKIAQRFNAGDQTQNPRVPKGTAESYFVPSSPTSTPKLPFCLSRPASPSCPSRLIALPDDKSISTLALFPLKFQSKRLSFDSFPIHNPTP